MTTATSSKTIPATYDALNAFSREELREYARSLDVERGQDKSDTITNLLKSRLARLEVSLVRKAEATIEHRLSRFNVVLGKSRIKKAEGRSMPGEPEWYAVPQLIAGNDLLVDIVRGENGHPETWNLEHTIVGLKQGFYVVEQGE